MRPPRPTPEDGAAAALAAAWLPTDDPDARTQLAMLFQRIAGLGLDPAAALRDALGRWFGAAASTALGGAEPPAGQTGDTPAAMMLLPLAGPRRPTLWPQRPRRRPDELFSSWLRRAAIAAGVPPRSFAREALGSELPDPDRAVSALVLHRLALASGQAPAALAAGTLLQPACATTSAGLVEDAALAQGGLLLGPRSSVQFCPLCLGGETCPAFRRGWRFGYEVACLHHGCLLHDRCPGCGATILPLRQRSTVPQPDCPACGERLREARPVKAAASAARQRALLRQLHAAAVNGDAEQLGMALARLAGTLATTGSAVAARATALATLQPRPSTPAPARVRRRPVVLTRRRPVAPPATGSG